jgi:competence protein ComGC
VLSKVAVGEDTLGQRLRNINASRAQTLVQMKILYHIAILILLVASLIPNIADARRAESLSSRDIHTLAKKMILAQSMYINYLLSDFHMDASLFAAW